MGPKNKQTARRGSCGGRRLPHPAPGTSLAQATALAKPLASSQGGWPSLLGPRTCEGRGCLLPPKALGPNNPSGRGAGRGWAFAPGWLTWAKKPPGRGDWHVTLKILGDFRGESSQGKGLCAGGFSPRRLLWGWGKHGGHPSAHVRGLYLPGAGSPKAKDPTPGSMTVCLPLQGPSTCRNTPEFQVWPGARGW